MKKIYLLFGMACCSLAVSAQTLISYGNKTISKDEFLRAYNKNKPAVTDKEKSYRDYVELYTNFKLKVQAAEALRLDTLQQISYDVANFRSQIIDNYLSDEKGIARLEQEAFERSLKDLHVLHFFVPVAPTASTADSLKAAAAINEISRQLNAGAVNYAGLVSEVSNKFAPARQSDIGFITVFSLPYEYENIIYATPVDKSSSPYRSSKGFHVFKVIGQRPSAGKWKVAQILFSFPPGATDEMKQAIGKRADSVYNLLNHGMSFSSAVKNFSDDRLTYLSEGQLPEFGTGKYSYAFEKEVFQLAKDGEITHPFETAYGYHIVKRLGFTPAVTDPNDETIRFEMKQRVMQDSRVNAEKEKFARNIVKLTNFKRNVLVKDADLFRFADSLGKDPSLEQTLKTPISKKTIASFPKANLTGADWLKFIRDYKYNIEQYKGETYPQLWDKFVTVSSVEYYKSHLEQYNPDFKFQMQEFKEGNMLFEIMERNVWNKAINDNAGLLSLYNANKSKYIWAPSADVLIFNCSTPKVAEKALADMKAGKYWRQISDESNATVQADSGRYEILQVMDADYKGTPSINTYSPVTTNADGTAVFVKFIRLYPGGEQRTFEEARGLVINDYQNVLEKNWVASLRQKNAVKLNEAVFRELLR